MSQFQGTTRQNEVKEYEQTSEEQMIEAQAEGQARNSGFLEEAQAQLIQLIDEEIDLTRNFNEDIINSHEDYKIFTSQFDEIVNAIDLATPESLRLRFN